MSTPDLDALRKQIDALDTELLKTIARRMEVVEAIGRYKKESHLELRDEERFRALLAGQLERSNELGLPGELVKELYELVHKYALEREAEA